MFYTFCSSLQFIFKTTMFLEDLPKYFEKVDVVDFKYE